MPQVAEKIDERILKILGLKDTFDLDYSDYSSLLKEKMVMISMGKSDLSREEEMLVRDEFKRVKGKTGKFKATKKKIGADAIKTEVKKTPSYYKSPFAKEQAARQQKVKPNNKVTALSTYVEKPESKKIPPGSLVKKESSALAKPIQDYSKKITKVATILETSQKQEKKFEIEKKKDEIKEKDDQKKKDIEDRLEKPNLPSLPKLSIPILNPVKSLFSRIFDALKILVAGWLVDKALIWINNPENQKKMKAVGDWFVSVGEWLDSDETKRKIGIITGFLKRHWLAIFGVGGIMLLWSNGIVRFTTKLVKSVVVGTAKLGFAAAKMAAQLAIKNPKAAAAFAGVTAGLYLANKEKVDPQLKKGATSVKDFAKGAVETGKGAYEAGSKFVDAGDKFFGVGAYEQNIGGITGFNSGGTVPVMLTRGEVVIPPNKAKQIGYNNLYAMNSLGNRRNEGGPIVPLNMGGGVKVVPGRGANVDTVRDRLPVGSFVLQRPAVDAMGGPQAIRGYNQGGYIIGDSIAKGMADTGGNYQGQTEVGAQPFKVLDFIKKIPSNNLKGKPVLLSTGASNALQSGGDISTIDKQLKYLKDAGAKVAVAGVATGPKSQYQPKLSNINSTLKSKVEEYGFGFGGGFTAGKDGLHPSNYSGFKSNLEKLISQSAGGDKPKGAINTIAQFGTPAQRALLDTISFAEGTYTKNREEGYKIMFTGKKFDAPPWKHPEKINSGGGYKSDAAGRYQFLSTTWKALKLPDFTPVNQDKGALQLIQNRYGSYQTELESKGLTDNLMNKISGIWASFPTLEGTSAYGQPVKKADTLRKKFGEILAGAGAGVGADSSTSTGTNTTGNPEGSTSGSSSTNPLDFFGQLYNFLDVLEGRTPQFGDMGGSTTSSSGGAPASGGSSPNVGPIQGGPMHQKGANIAKELMRLLSIKDYQAAGIVGNLIQESSLVPDRIQGSGMKRGPLKLDGRTGYSYPQWTSIDRQKAFANYMESKGFDWRNKGATDEMATGFLAKEFKGYMSSVFTNTKDVASASNWVLKNYEKPADQGAREQQERAADSKAVLDKISKGLRDGGIVQYLNKGGYAGAIKYFSTNDGRTNKILEPGKEYSYSDTLWHHGASPGAGKNARRTHGWPRDYTLLDGPDLTGPNSKIPIPVDGEILDVIPSPGGGYGNHVIAKTGLGNMLFAHFSKLGNIKKGDKVSAGTVLGVQGNTPGGMADHLHLDASEAGHAAFINYITTGKPITGSLSSGAPGADSKEGVTPSTGEPTNPLDFFGQLYDYIDKLKPSTSQSSTSSPIATSTSSESKLTQNIQKVSSTPPSKTKPQSTSSVNTIPLPPEVVKTPPPPKSKEDAQKEKMGKPTQKTPTPSVPTYDGVTSSSGQGGFQWSYAEYFGVK